MSEKRQSSISCYLQEDEGAKPLPSHQKPFLQLIETDREKTWLNRIIKTHHSYVPSTNFCGRSIHWIIKNDYNKIMGTISIGSAIMAMKPRDHYIGWNKELRLKNLINIANNTRYCLIGTPPKNFGSQVLSLLCKLAPKEWKNKYGDELVLLETLVEPPHTGAVYKASNWICVGKTKGTEFKWVSKEKALILKNEGWGVTQKECKYGDSIDKNKWKVCRENGVRKKFIFVKPLCKNWKDILCFSGKET